MTILWDVDPTALETYHLAVADRVQVVGTEHLVTQALAADGREVLVVVGPGIDIQDACDLAAALRLQRPEVGVVLLRRRPEVKVLAQALRHGIREVVGADDPAALAGACRRSMELSSALAGAGVGQASAPGRVVTVFSAKGGVGKTTIATNLGVYLASTGSRVLLVDLDLAFGDVAVSLQLAPTRSTTDLIAMSGDLDAQGLAAAVTRHDSGLDTLCAPDAPADADLIPAAMTTQLLRVARGMYDFVIVDTPPAFNEHVLATFDLTDVSILIATMDVSAVKNLRMTLNTMDQLGYAEQSRVIVLNRSDVRAGLKVADVAAVTLMPIAVCIPDSLAVPASINRGVAIVVDAPEHPVSVALRALADGHVRPGRATVAATGRQQGSRNGGIDRTFAH
ncbi:MAG: AAA family ATPase [Dermatophilaceae bacterium]